MGIFVEIVKWLLVFNASVAFIDAMYRILTENDKYRSWKEEAFTDLIVFLVDLVLIIGLCLGW